MFKGVFGRSPQSEAQTASNDDEIVENEDPQAASDARLLRDVSVAEGDMASDAGGRANPERQKLTTLISTINHDIDVFENNITQNEFHLKHSREQLRGFKAFVHQAEVDFEDIFRLREQKNDLAEQLDMARTRANTLQRELDVERANAAAVQNRIAEFRNALETARSELVAAVEKDRAYREEIEKFNLNAAERETELLDVRRLADKLVAENKVLKEDNERLSSDLVVSVKKATELEKSLDSAVETASTDRDDIERLTADLVAATDSLDNYQAENVELQSRLENAIAENAALEKRAMEKVRIREDELFSLRARVDALQSELRIKAQMVSQAMDESRVARSEAKVAKAAAQDLSEQLVREVQRREEHREQLLAANAENAELTKRFNHLIEELEMARRENLHLQRMLRVERHKHEYALEAPLTSEEEAKKDLLANMPEPDTSKPN